QLGERASEIAVRRFREIAQPDVAGPLVDHERALDRRDVDLVAFDVQIEQLLPAAPLDRDVDGGSLRPFQAADGLLARPAFRVLAFDLGDDVAAAQAAFVRGRAFEDRGDMDLPVDDLDAQTEAVVAAFLTLTHLRVAARVEEARVRIERLQHAVDGAVDD